MESSNRRRIPAILVKFRSVWLESSLPDSEINFQIMAERWRRHRVPTSVTEFRQLDTKIQESSAIESG
jgi:hypothetical protein